MHAVWEEVIGEIMFTPRALRDAEPIAGARLAGQGFTADVWAPAAEEATGEVVIKLYRLAAPGVRNVYELMRAEMETYERLQRGALPSPLPHMHAAHIIEGVEGTDNVCGWAVFDRLPGEALSIEKLAGLSSLQRALFINALVAEAVRMEQALAAIDHPPAAWNDSYAPSRVSRILKMPDLSRENMDITVHLNAVIAQELETAPRIFIHGDFNPPNIMTDVLKGGRRVGLIDPLINHDVTEANWRHLTFVPAIAEACATHYEALTGKTANRTLMYALGALTHHYMGLVLQKTEPEQAGLRFQARNACLARMQP